MGGHAGWALHYHGFGDDRYGHRHYYLSIFHEHDEDDEQPDRTTDA